MEWILAPRQGTKNGKQNSQLELGLVKLKVSEIVEKMRSQLKSTIKHKAELDWKRHALKLDLTMSD